MKVRQYFEVKGGTPDPATYCPANGYIPNPINPDDGWFLIAEFDTNSPNSTTFDPAITTTSGDYAWDLGDGTIIVGDKYFSHTYASSATKTVKLYGKGTCNITQIFINDDHIVGELDLSNDAFKTCTYWDLYSNASLTSVILPSEVTAEVRELYINNCNLTGTLDVSGINKWNNQAFINLSSNSNLTAITWADSFVSPTGISSLTLSYTGLTGNIDLSVFKQWSGNSTINIVYCPNITGITWAAAGTMSQYVMSFNINYNVSLTSLDLSPFQSVLYPTGLTFNLHNNSAMTSLTMPNTGTKTISYLQAHQCNLTGTLDLSMISNWATGATFSLNNNSLLTEITWPSSTMGGSLAGMYIHTTGITGTLDLTKINTFTSNANISLHANASMTGITFASSITGAINNFNIYSTGITGTLDLSKFTAFATNAIWSLHTNSSMTGVTFASSFTGTIAQLYLYSCNLTGTLDLSKFTTWSSNALIQAYSNPLMTGITFASSITGTFNSLRFNSTGITGTFDLSKFTSFTAAAHIYIQSNSSMTGVTFAASITGTMTEIYAQSTGLTSIDLSMFTSWYSTGGTLYLYSNTGLTSVTFPSSTISGFLKTLQLYGCTSLGYVDLTKLRTGIASISWILYDNSWSATIVNHVLVDIDSISGPGYTGRVINIGGTNADPDTTSGGYDGTAARNQLITDGFTVTIT